MRFFLLLIGIVCSFAGNTQITVPQTTKAFYGIIDATWCGYCGQYGVPYTADIINQTFPKATYASLHRSNTSALYAPTANDIATEIGVSGQPIFTVNAFNLGPHSSTIVNEVVDSINNFYTSSSATVNAGFNYGIIGANLYVHTETKFFSTLNGNYHMAVYVMEDSIWEHQTNYAAGPDTNIWHNHILRTSVNGSFGELVASGTITSGNTFNKNYSIPIDPSWDTSQIYIYTVIWKESGGSYTFINSNDTGGTLSGNASMEQQDSMGISVYPNPTTNQFVLSTPQNGVLNIFNLDGKMIRQINVLQGNNIINLNVKKGIYILQLQTATTSFREKIIVE